MVNKFQIVAEVAQGYLGKRNLCEDFIMASSKAGATAIKFQVVYADELCTQDYKYFKLFKSLEMKNEEWIKINAFSKKNNIELFLDIFGEKSLKLAEKLKIKTIKVHPTDIDNVGFLKKIALSNIKNIILGVGGYEYKKIVDAIKLFGNNKNLIIMHGFQGYPTLEEENNLYRINFLKNNLNKKNISFAFADHTLPESKYNYLPSIIAIGQGVKLIEKHITISKILKMEDYESAFNPDEFNNYVNLINISNKILGEKNQTKKQFYLSDKEKKYLKEIRRSYIAKRKIPKNTKIDLQMLVLKRSSNKKSLSTKYNILNKTLLKTKNKNQVILFSDIKK